MSNTNKRQSLQSERSFDGSSGRPTKYFKLDRTYSDVVEDELYDPQPEEEKPPSFSEKDSPRKTQRIQNAYPQLFTQTLADSPPNSDSVTRRSEQYWPGMESGIRFDRSLKTDLHGEITVIADRKQKLSQQPEPITVSPKEAFLDFPDNADFDPKGSVFEHSDVKTEGSSHSIAPRRIEKHKSGSRDQSSQFPTLSRYDVGDIAAPKTITPVRAHERLSPKPVNSSQARTPSSMMDPRGASGPSATQAHSNATANERIRALYKEDSTTSNISVGSDLYTPSSVAESETEGTLNNHVVQDGLVTVQFECQECHDIFERASLRDLHSRQHARPPATILSPQEKDDNEYSDEDECEDYDAAPNKSKTKIGGPHRCDWIIPATGQICGTVFSRPYDLVRHQDTIHRAKKLEFKCEICIAAGVNKIFSRNDALVRHMRHVHKRDLAKKH